MYKIELKLVSREVVTIVQNFDTDDMHNLLLTDDVQGLCERVKVALCGRLRSEAEVAIVVDGQFEVASLLQSYLGVHRHRERDQDPHQALYGGDRGTNQSIVSV